MEKESKSFIKNINIKIVIPILIIIIIIGAFIFTTQMGLKKEITIETGTKTLSLKDFYKHGIILNDITFITDVSKINLNKTGDYKITLKEKNKEKYVTLHLVDTTAPVVAFKNVEGNKEYIINPQDFIESINDISETTVTITNQLDIKDYNIYDVKVVVSDKSGNKTEGNCKLSISFIKLNYELELGNTLKKSDLVYAPEDEKYINQEDIDKINNGDLGEYEISTSLNGVNFKSKIIKQDTLPPELELNQVTIYTNKRVNGKEAFIKNVKDASGEITTTLKTEIDYSKIGNQQIIIEAVDKYNNKIEKETTLTIKADNDPPAIYGLNDIYVNKYSGIDYYSGVWAEDANDGKVDYYVDYSAVNTSVYGTYYATYTATDSLGNKATATRTINVLHDYADTQALLDYHAARAGSDFYSIRSYVMNLIPYSWSWGGDDPIWYGLTTYNGNCYVHALIYQELLTRAGYESKIIWVTDRSHYWNIVKINGVWKHSDSTPTYLMDMIVAENDAVRYEHLQGRDWDRSAWPEAR